jgi:hypothetical protein
LEDLLLISPSPAAQNHLLSMFAEFVAPMGSNLLSATVGNVSELTLPLTAVHMPSKLHDMLQLC